MWSYNEAESKADPSYEETSSMLAEFAKQAMPIFTYICLLIRRHPSLHSQQDIHFMLFEVDDIIQETPVEMHQALLILAVASKWPIRDIPAHIIFALDCSTFTARLGIADELETVQFLRNAEIRICSACGKWVDARSQRGELKKLCGYCCVAMY